MCVIKKILALLIIFFFNFNCAAYAQNNDSKTILIICSYNANSDWENSILLGLKDYFYKKTDYNLKFEYLDVTSFDGKEYYKDTSSLLNLKYIDQNIDLIITIDDEAFDFVKSNLLNKDSFIYKHKIFCIGVNSLLNLTSLEKDYVAGLIDNQQTYQSINLISTLIPKINDIYIALDENIYSTTIRESINENKDLLDKEINIHYLVSNYLNDIVEGLKDINSFNSAILLCGTFNYEKDMSNSLITINDISTVTSVPIFSTLEHYINAGAIGGYVNDGYHIGYKSAQYVNDMLNDYNIVMFYDSSDLTDKCIMNFKLLRKNKINPLKLPANTIYINKSVFDLTLPLWLTIIVWLTLTTLIIGIVFLIIWIFYNKRIKNTIIKELEKSEEREKIKTDFLIIMSHELRTPLNIILNTAKLLLNRCNKGDCNPEFVNSRIEYICNNANRLLRSVNNSIDVAKLDAQVYDVNYTMVNIIEIIDDIVDLTAKYAEQYNVDIIFDPEQEEIFTAIDIEKIEKIMINLISNAIKNISNEGTIFIKCRCDDKTIFLDIEDNGRGMSPEIKSHIFDKYYHSPFKNLARSTEGSGIGLYIVKKFIEILDGNIYVDSTLGVGSIFHISLPIKNVDNVKSKFDAFNNKDKVGYLLGLEFSEITKRK